MKQGGIASATSSTMAAVPGTTLGRGTAGYGYPWRGTGGGENIQELGLRIDCSPGPETTEPPLPPGCPLRHSCIALAYPARLSGESRLRQFMYRHGQREPNGRTRPASRPLE